MGLERRTGMRIMDRAEYASKPKPLTFPPTATVAEAIAAMCDLNYGSVMVVDEDDKVIGVMTERDVMRKIANTDLSAKDTTLEQVMTRDPRLAREEDDIVDWLRIMSNERFRRLPVVDNDGRIKAVFTQGDFVSYTWPELMYQMAQLGKATLIRNFPVVLVVVGGMIYTLLMVVVLSVVL